MTKVICLSIFIIAGYSVSHAASVISDDFHDPFYSWPANITVDSVDSEINLLCVVRNCDNGPFLVIDGVRKSPDHNLTEAVCKLSPNQSRADGVWLLQITSSLREILNRTEVSDPISVRCRTGDDLSPKSYIHMRKKTTEVTTTKPSPCTPPISDTFKGTNENTTSSALTFTCSCTLLWALLVTNVLITR